MNGDGWGVVAPDLDTIPALCGLGWGSDLFETAKQGRKVGRQSRYWFVR